MVVDTGTVRLVIFLGMFLVFAGDYSSLVASIFGQNYGKSPNSTSVRGPEGPPIGGSRSADNLGLTMDEKEEDEENASAKDHLDFLIIDRLTGTSTRLYLLDYLIEKPGRDATRRAKMMATIKNACLPKLICELTSSPYQDQLSEMEKSLLNLIRDTSLTTMAEVASRYHFAAHMGQLIAGVEGQGCHNFYPTCPLPRSSVLNMMKKIRLR